MIRQLGKHKKVTIFWDSDEYYIKNENHEAGYYFRKSSLFNENSHWIENFLTTSKKTVEITAVPLQSGQAKYAGELLQKLSSEGLLNIHNTAIILPDENMLFPVLYSLPAELQPINVTMGYPLKQSQYGEILQILHDLHRHSRSDQHRNHIFYHRYVTRLFAHPLLSGLINNQRKEYEHLNYMDARLIAETFEFKESNYYFREITQSNDLFDYIISFLILIQQNHSNKKEHELHFEDTITEYIRSEISHLRDQLEGYLEQVPVSTSWYLIKECLSGLKIPFSGEPVKGLQVMGFLETRALDFETIIILGMNEGTLPSTGGARSFIPYSLRKGFGLPTYEDQDASYSYHFYRLLHKAKNIFLLYNSEVNKTGGGEPSRYILQIKHELKKIMGPALELNFKTINTPITPGKTESILIPKNDHIKEYLQKYLLSYVGASPKSFSSSALTTYINCSLQFYFRYIAHLREKEELDDKIEVDVFGNIFHLAMENLYKGTNQITAELIDSIVNKADEEVENAIKKEYGISYLQLEGHDILLAEVIKELVKKILIRDKSETPFSIIQLEGSYESKISMNSGDARLMGKFDRVDESNGVTRIVDYKTGKVELKKGNVEDLFSNPKYKTLFQLYFYALLYKNNFPEKTIKTGFYVARSIESGVLFPGDGNPVSDEELALFAKGLQNLRNNIFDQQVPFSQTDDIKRCEYCEYRNICQR
ncbi:MAG TPA: PD-(D/E)XK nuclease family protein, partial [Bacteroidia bacterium]|nr:PD-(D/E)XK nuclease family protein [Bacteroidia bacterium]